MKPQYIKTKKDPEMFSYYNSKGEQLYSYRHKYYDSLGKRKEKGKQGFKSENACYRALLEVRATIVNGNVKRVDNESLTIAEWFDIWYETNKTDWKVTSQLQRKDFIKNQVKPLLGKYKLSSLDKSTYKREFINALIKEKYEPSTVQLFHRLFKVAINAAVDDEIIPRNRFLKISIEVEKKDDNFLTTGQLNALLSHVKKYDNISNYTAILLLAYTGLRKGEAQGLKWNNINFDDKTLTVECTRDNKGIRTPKTNNSYRTIIIDDVLLNQLKVYKTWCKELKLSMGIKWQESDFILISYQTGVEVTDNFMKNCLDRVIDKKVIPKITPHGLRHTHATILIAQRIPVKVIADRLGNTPQMILDIYGHSFKDLEQESVQAFSTALNM